MILNCTCIPRAALAMTLALGLAACATTSDQYPSLAKRESERYYGTLQPVSQDAGASPESMPDPQLGQRLASLRSDAAIAHGAFASALPQIRATTEAAAGAAMGTDSWFAAQAAISGLESQRARTMIALAELDRLYIAAQLDGGARDAIAAAQAEVDTMVQEENGQITQLLSRLGQ